MLGWLKTLKNLVTPPHAVPEDLWQLTLANYPFLADRPAADQNRLRSVTEEFLAQKEFSGAHGLVITDEMAVVIAAQASLPIINLGLKLYDDFKGIVVHAGAMLAQRKAVDAAGVHHFYKDEIYGEAMQGGPVTLSWQDVAPSDDHQTHGFNVVIHEFVHKLDMRDGAANGCPPLSTRQAKEHWRSSMQTAYDTFQREVVMAQRFGAEKPWLDAYGATSPAEFFAVASEAYFVNPSQFQIEFADLKKLFDSFYSPSSAVA